MRPVQRQGRSVSRQRPADAAANVDWAQRYGARRLDYATWDTEKLNRACDSDATVVALWLADSDREPAKEFYARTGAAWVAKMHGELMRRINEEFAPDDAKPV